MPVLRGEYAVVLVNQRLVELHGLRVGDVELVGILPAGIVGKLVLRVVLQPDVHMARGIDFRNHIDAVVVRLLDELPDVIARVVRPCGGFLGIA